MVNFAFQINHVILLNTDKGTVNLYAPNNTVQSLNYIFKNAFWG